MIELKIKFLSENAKDVYGSGRLLNYQTVGSSGIDIRAVDVFLPATKETFILGKDIDSYELQPMERAVVQTGLAAGGLSDEYEIQVRPRSGLAFRSGITIVNMPGTIDSDYRGEIFVGLRNQSGENQTVFEGDRIAQMVILPFEKVSFRIVDSLPESERGNGGCGSSGK